ncbi:non-canonical purine NTP pyrophosphatase, RdgB/HAM1 family [Psittacicella melopsittaci]|uniref:dITP/XTP pyrophosphatase n=1 Tax=Psittacicella melopsittaci TaxID=2028576 RepID=A0A3A1Y3Q9_9GAMM|nr:RdgB/HAM1 family non-canonical purine NTP pyrophosphatase [Psittacicella melopsittaci]RIY31886.1 non-canonical purine NTP pyrophosphatase, RdgB/HAM1 family [Psittacicella melopsittaci]
MKKTIVIATSNRGKLHEFDDLFAHANLGENLELKILADYPDFVSPVEDAPSFIGNALIKAYHAAKVTGLPALADDSGLCVDALNSAPGIYSSRYAQMHNFNHEHLDKEKQNYSCLLEQMEAIPEQQRQAHFYCCLVLVRFPDDPEPLVAVGKCHGEIMRAPLGEHGHGYDPVFYSYDLEKSFAQATLSEKNTVSHRTLAFNDLLTRGLKDFLA